MVHADASAATIKVRTIRAQVRRGALAPLAPLDVPEGSEVELTVSTPLTIDDIVASKAAAGGWRGAIDADELIRNIYEDRLTTTRARSTCACG